MPTAMCPECENNIFLSSPKKAMKVSCPNCEAELEIVDLHPLELDWVSDDDDDDWDDEESWDDDDDDDSDSDDDWDDED